MISAIADLPLALRMALIACPLLLASLTALLLNHTVKREQLARRLREVVTGPQPRQNRAADVKSRLVESVAGVGGAVASSGVFSGKALAGIRSQLATAGLRGGNALGVFLGSKIILACACPVAVIAFLPSDIAPGLPHKMIIVGSAIVGLLLPEWILRFLQKRYIGAIEAGLPDMLDMLVMCTESGLSLEPALVRVCQEIGPIHPAMAQELRLTTGELHILTDTRMAFTNLGERSGVRGLKRLSSTLIQTLQYGTPLGPSLRSLTGEMRQEMLTKFEERAGRLPALLTLVMIVFILPSLFLTIGGPAIIQVLRQFGS